MRASLLRWAAASFVLAAASASSMACGTAVTDPARPVPNPVLMEVYETSALPNGETLPPVVARLGDLKLTAAQFAEKVAEARYSNARRQLGLSEKQLRRRALEGWLRQAALHERARAEGISVSDAEVQAFMVQQAQLRHEVLASNPQGAADYQAFIEARGYKNPDDYDRDPRAIEGARWLLETNKLIKKDLPASATQVDRDQFVATTMAQANLQTFIPFS
jgi:SurA N-terminal domain